MKYIIRDKEGKEILVTYSENQAYERVDFSVGDTIEELPYNYDEEL
jgi:hypothetical protein